jgi:aldehyde dehydrogenase (NAD+)
MGNKKGVKTLLEKLNIKPVNPGACTGPNAWIADPKGTELISFNPTTGEAIASILQASPETYNTIINKAIEAFQAWRMLPAPQRGQVVRDLGNALREFKEPLGELVSLEMGKIRAEGLGEVQEMIDICDFATGLSRQLYGLTMHSERPQHRMYEQWHPLGVTGIISAFNFPVAVWSWNAAIASICGNTTVWKPSLGTPLTAIATQHIVNRVMADYGLDGVFNLVIGANEVIGECIINDHRLPLVSFTGSTQIGRHVAGRVAQRLGKSLLELGGNNAMIIAEDANLDLAVRAIVFGAVGTAGQRCTSTRRIIMHQAIADELIERLLHAYQQVVVGDPLQANTLMGPLINATAVNNMMLALKMARSQGGEILFGGEALPEKGPYFVTPALVKMRSQTQIVQQETFAPILYLMTYRYLDEAILLQNEVSHGLSSAIFTSNLLTSEQFLSARGSDCGIANVNIGTSGAEIGGAFGGEKDTGGGRESGSDAWKAYMRRQTNTINWSNALPLAQGIQFSV